MVMVFNALSVIGLVVIGGGFIAGFIYVWKNGDDL